LRIGVIGYSGDINKPPVKPLVELCETLGEEIARRGHVLVNGGRDGVMEAVSKGAMNFGGIVVGILPKSDFGNDYLTVAIDTGMDFSMRSILMMYNVDVVISIGGKVGTALELFAAYAHSKSAILLRGTGGWTDRIASILLDGKYIDDRKLAEVKSAWSVQEALEMVEALGATR